MAIAHPALQLSDPTGKVLGKQIRQSTGQLAITADKDGRHEYCFSNQMSAIADKMVSFNVHGVIYVTGDGQSLLPLTQNAALMVPYVRCCCPNRTRNSEVGSWTGFGQG